MYTALVAYDHIGTVAQEVQLIWGHRINSTVVLFHLNRWLIMIWVPVTLILAFSPLETLQVSTFRICGTAVITDIAWRRMSFFEAREFDCAECGMALLFQLQWMGRLQRTT